jgi:hypothetical protein
MLRGAVGVVVSYVAMAVLVFVMLSLLWMVLGASGAFESGSFQTSMTWSVASLVLGFAAAVVGGWLCAKIAQGPTAPKVLAGLVLVLGLLFCIPVLMQDPSTEARAGDMPMLQAMQKAVTPAWVALLNPIVGAAGVMLGARRKRS